MDSQIQIRIYVSPPTKDKNPICLTCLVMVMVVLMVMVMAIVID